MELYINNGWTKCYGDSYFAEAIVWSENGNNASICTTGAPPKKRMPNSWVLCENSNWYLKKPRESSGNGVEYRRKSYSL